MSAMDLNIELKGAPVKQYVSKKVAVAAGVIAMAGCYALNHVSHAAGFALVANPLLKDKTLKGITSKFTAAVVAASKDRASCPSGSIDNEEKAKACIAKVVELIKKELTDTVAKAGVAASPTDVVTLKDDMYDKAVTAVDTIDKKKAWVTDDLWSDYAALFTDLMGRLDKKIGHGLKTDNTETCGLAVAIFKQKCETDVASLPDHCKSALEKIMNAVKVAEAKKLGAEVSAEAAKCLPKFEAAATAAGATGDAIKNWIAAMKSTTTNWLLYAGIALLVVALAGVGVFLYMKNKKAKAAPAAAAAV